MVASFFKAMFGGGSPKVETAAPQDVTEDEEKTKKVRTALYSTAGQAAGEEVSTVGTSGRSTLYGN